MYRVNIEVRPIIDMIAQINAVEATIPLSVQRTAETMRTEVVSRIQNRGLNSEGAQMVTSSAQKIGRYSRRHGKNRQKRGLQTNRIDLTFTGAMMRDFQAERVNGRTAEVAFRSDAAAELAGYNEERFGVAFTLSYPETDKSVDFYVSTFNGFFR